MEHCLLCHKEGHNAFCCDSSRARIVDETITHWMGARLYNLYQTSIKFQQKKITFKNIK